MTFSLFSIAILLIFFSVTATEVYRSIKKGFRKSLVSLGVAILSVFFSSLLAFLISEIISAIVSYFVLNNINEYLELVETYPWSSAFIDSLMGVILGILLFVPVFFATRGIIGWLVGIVQKMLSKRFADTPAYCYEKDSFFDRNDKALSIVTGIVISFVITMVITSPIMGTLDVANKAKGIVAKFNGSIPASVVETMDKVGVPVCANDFFGNVFYQLGGKMMYNSAASADVYGERAHLVNEVEALEDVFDDLQYSYTALTDPQNATDEQISRIYSLCDNVERLELCSGPLGGIISTFSSAWKNGDLFLGMYKPTTNDLIEPAFDEMLTICENTDHNSSKANMITLLKIYATVMDSKVLEVDVSNMESLVSFVNESGIIEKLDAILAANPHMSGISLSSIAMAAVSQYIQEFDFDSERYEVLMEDIADAINQVNGRGYATDEEKAKVLASYAQEYIRQYGVGIPDDMATSVAEEILKQFNEGSITKEDVEKLFNDYAK